MENYTNVTGDYFLLYEDPAQDHFWKIGRRLRNSADLGGGYQEPPTYLHVGWVERDCDNDEELLECARELIDDALETAAEQAD